MIQNQIPKTIPNKHEAILQLLYFGIDKSGNFFHEKWTCPPKEFRQHMDKWNANYVNTVMYQNLIGYIDNLFKRDIKDVEDFLK